MNNRLIFLVSALASSALAVVVVRLLTTSADDCLHDEVGGGVTTADIKRLNLSGRGRKR